jgi:hypothetical protein
MLATCSPQRPSELRLPLRALLILSLFVPQVEVRDKIITFLEAPSYPKIVARANNTALTRKTVMDFGLESTVPKDLVNSTLGGIAFGADMALYMKQGLVSYPNAGKLYNKPSLSPAPNGYVFSHIDNWAQMWQPSTSDCAPAWRDPRDDVMATLVRSSNTRRWSDLVVRMRRHADTSTERADVPYWTLLGSALR